MFLEGRRENLDNDTDLGIVAEPQIDVKTRFVYLYEQIVLPEQIQVLDQLELRPEERSEIETEIVGGPGLHRETGQTAAVGGDPALEEVILESAAGTYPCICSSGNILMLKIEKSPHRRFLAEPELHPQSALHVVGVFGDQIDRQTGKIENQSEALVLQVPAGFFLLLSGKTRRQKCVTLTRWAK